MSKTYLIDCNWKWSSQVCKSPIIIYVESTVWNSPVCPSRIKKICRVHCIQTNRITWTRLGDFQLNRPWKYLKRFPNLFLITKNMNPVLFLILKTFLDDFITEKYYRSSSLELRLDRICLKTCPEHVALLTENIFLPPFKLYLNGFFVSLEKTIVLYLVKKFEAIVVILTSGRNRVFLKEKKIFIASFRTVHFILNLQAKLCTIINYYKIYIYYYKKKLLFLCVILNITCRYKTFIKFHKFWK